MAAALPEIKGWTTLHEAAAHPSELQCLEGLLKNCADEVNQQIWCGETPLHVACQCKCREGVKEAVCLLLQYGANPNLSDKQGRTPLLCAAKKGYLDVVTALLNSGNADPDLGDNFGQNPVHVAAFEGHWDIVEILIQAGGSSPTHNIDGVTPIYLAASYNQTATLEKLIMVAVGRGQKEVIDLRSKFGFTPLMDAARSGHAECVEILLRFGADPHLKVNVLSSASLTALHFAIYGNYIECIRLLLEKMDIQYLIRRSDCACTDYACPLQAAISKKNCGALNQLLLLGFPVDNVHKISGRQHVNLSHRPSVYSNQLTNYQTALSYAAGMEDLNSMKILMDYGACVNSVLYERDCIRDAKPKLSFPPVLSALCNKGWKAFDLLIERGCDISRQPDGVCPSECLLLALYNRHSTDKLLMFGCDPLLIFKQPQNDYDGILRCFGDVFTHVSYKDFIEIIELLFQYMVVCSPVQRFLYDVFRLCRRLDPTCYFAVVYNERWKAILQQINAPSTLKHCCRIKIRQVAFFSGRFREAIEALRLPELLKNYLLYITV